MSDFDEEFDEDSDLEVGDLGDDEGTSATARRLDEDNLEDWFAEEYAKQGRYDLLSGDQQARAALKMLPNEIEKLEGELAALKSDPRYVRNDPAIFKAFDEKFRELEDRKTRLVRLQRAEPFIGVSDDALREQAEVKRLEAEDKMFQAENVGNRPLLREKLEKEAAEARDAAISADTERQLRDMDDAIEFAAQLRAQKAAKETELKKGPLGRPGGPLNPSPHMTYHGYQE